MLLHNWNVLCWNVRGLNAPEIHLALGNAIQASGCVVICLQESKMHFLTLPLLNLYARNVLISLPLFLRMVLRVASLRFGTVVFSQAGSFCLSNLRWE